MNSLFVLQMYGGFYRTKIKSVLLDPEEIFFVAGYMQTTDEIMTHKGFIDWNLSKKALELHKCAKILCMRLWYRQSCLILSSCFACVLCVHEGKVILAKSSAGVFYQT